MGQRPFRIGTRGSPLALAQAREAGMRLCQAHGWPSEAIEIVAIRTTGDAVQDRALSEAGGKGLFTKELDVALADEAIDLAVHSAKDLPTVLPDGIVIAGYLPREDARDVLIAREATSIAELGQGAVVGSASLRRQAQLRRLRPDLQVTLLRGNVQTRLAKVKTGTIDATLLALAGLKRLGLAHEATAVLGTDEFLPAVGQGAIALTMRRGDPLQRTVAPVLDRETGIALSCERAFLTVLDGSCRTPIAGYAAVRGGGIAFRGLLLSPDGAESAETAVDGTAEEAVHLGEAAARDLLARAPKGILASIQAP